MVWIEIINSCVGENFAFSSKHKYLVDKKIAKDLINAGHAKEIKAPEQPKAEVKKK